MKPKIPFLNSSNTLHAIFLPSHHNSLLLSCVFLERVNKKKTTIFFMLSMAFERVVSLFYRCFIAWHFIFGSIDSPTAIQSILKKWLFIGNEQKLISLIACFTVNLKTCVYYFFFLSTTSQMKCFSRSSCTHFEVLLSMFWFQMDDKIDSIVRFKWPKMNNINKPFNKSPACLIIAHFGQPTKFFKAQNRIFRHLLYIWLFRFGFDLN